MRWRRILCVYRGHKPTATIHRLTATFETTMMLQTECIRCHAPMVIEMTAGETDPKLRLVQ